MPSVIGTGVSALKEFVEKCERAGGVPIIRTRFGGRELDGGSAVIVACWGKGAEVKGGKITGLPRDVFERIDKAPKSMKYKVVKTL